MTHKTNAAVVSGMDVIARVLKKAFLENLLKKYEKNQNLANLLKNSVFC